MFLTGPQGTEREKEGAGTPDGVQSTSKTSGMRQQQPGERYRSHNGLM